MQEANPFFDDDSDDEMADHAVGDRGIPTAALFAEQVARQAKHRTKQLQVSQDMMGMAGLSPRSSLQVSGIVSLPDSALPGPKSVWTGAIREGDTRARSHIRRTRSFSNWACYLIVRGFLSVGFTVVTGTGEVGELGVENLTNNKIKANQKQNTEARAHTAQVRRRKKKPPPTLFLMMTTTHIELITTRTSSSHLINIIFITTR